MSSKIKNITRLVQGKTLAKASVSAAAARAAASKTTTERPLTTDVDNHQYKEGHGPRKHIWEDVERRNSLRMNLWNGGVDGKKTVPEFDPTFLAYQNKVIESEGFDVDGDHGLLLQGDIGPLGRSKDELAEEFNGHAESAIQLYNKKMGAKFKFVEMEKANWQPPLTYLITFTAVEDENDEPKVFQAAVKKSFPSQGDPPTVTLCRQKGNRLEGYMIDEYMMGWRR